jgi:hypothetical protein
MQLVPRYLVKNRIDIVADLAGFVTEYRPVYKRHTLVYKGIDNVLEFRLLNADQKPINTQGYTPKFVAYDMNKTKIIEHDGTVLDDGSSATKGLFTVTITENDLLNIASEYLTYTVYLVDDDDDSRILTYTDTHFGADSVIRVSGTAFPDPKASKTVTSFTDTGGIYVSSIIDADPGINSNEGLHTVAVYSNSFEGTINIEVTLENQVTGTTDWASVGSLVFTGDETEPTPFNFTGVFNFLRFTTEDNPSSISKILVRN